MKYIIEEYVLNEYNASSKARKDISHFVLQNGFQSLGKNDKTKIRHNKLAKTILAFKLFMRIFSLGKEDTLFLQTSNVLLKQILRIKRIKNFKIIFLIHDLYCLRYSEPESIRINESEINTDIKLMSQCDYIIAHNPIMVDRLKQFGCTSNIISLNIFDYIYNLPVRRTKTRTPDQRIQVVFAGNLSKSKFLQNMDNKPHNYNLIIYGGPEMKFRNSIYKGCVDADILPNIIEGHFGLIWEGDFIAKETDNYLCVNNPHKMSMYIVAGLPIIVWRKSAAAKFVEENKIGITIESLDEIDTIADKLTTEQYSIMVENCHKIRQSLVHGEHIYKALSSCQ